MLVYLPTIKYIVLYIFNNSIIDYNITIVVTLILKKADNITANVVQPLCNSKKQNKV